MTTMTRVAPVAAVQQSTALNTTHLLAAATWLAGRTDDSPYTTLRHVEKMSLAALRATPVRGNLFAVLQLALAEGNPAGGVAGVKVGDTVGDVMDTLGLNQTQVNQIACYCKNGDSVHPAHIAISLRNIAGVF